MEAVTGQMEPKEKPKKDVDVECFACEYYSRWNFSCSKYLLKRSDRAYRSYPRNRIHLKVGLCKEFSEAIPRPESQWKR